MIPWDVVALWLVMLAIVVQLKHRIRKNEGELEIWKLKQRKK